MDITGIFCYITRSRKSQGRVVVFYQKLWYQSQLSYSTMCDSQQMRSLRNAQTFRCEHMKETNFASLEVYKKCYHAVSIMHLSIMHLSITLLSIILLSIVHLSITLLSIMHLSIMHLSTNQSYISASEINIPPGQPDVPQTYTCQTADTSKLPHDVHFVGGTIHWHYIGTFICYTCFVKNRKY